MLNDGATFIDIGANSTKKTANFVDEQEEIKRIVPAVKVILKYFPEVLLSIDTFRSEVARVCIENGAAIINDIAAGELDDKMFSVIAKYDVPYIMMHMRGNPQTMYTMMQYDNITLEMFSYFYEKIKIAKSLGINYLLLDPGFGFAKTIDHDFEILKKLDLFNFLEVPVLVGVSRKPMIYETLGSTPIEALNGTTVINTMALLKNAKILRVHDVKEAMELITLFNRYSNL